MSSRKAGDPKVDANLLALAKDVERMDTFETWRNIDENTARCAYSAFARAAQHALEVLLWRVKQGRSGSKRHARCDRD